MGRRTNTAKWLEKYNRWQIKVQKDGERRTFTSSKPGRNGQRECNAKADVWLDGGIVSPGLKVHELYANWMIELKSNTSLSNWRSYEVHWRIWIKPVIGNRKVQDLTEQHLQTVINKAFAAGKSKKYLGSIRAGMSAMLKFARKCRATALVVENVYIPKGAPVGERIILQPDDIIKLFTCNETLYKGKVLVEPYINAYRFALATGLRPGEIIGLRDTDIISDRFIDLKNSINVHCEVTAGKNENAQRQFVLKAVDIEILNKQRKYLLETGLRSQYVFPHEDGGHMNPSTYYQRWIRYRDYNGISKASPYELRHTFVSIVKGLPEGLIKDIVGHSKAMDTFGVYGHQLKGQMQQTAELIQDEFSKLLELAKKDVKTAI